jgi:hypothetical protein
MFRQMFAINDINNGALKTTNAMPQKDSTSDGTASFEIGRMTNRRIYTTNLPTNAEYVQKKWIGGNRDASQVIQNRRVLGIASGSKNTASNTLSFTTYKDVNTIYNALTRVRAGGAVANQKKRANLNNAPTPRFSPAIPPNDIRGIKYPVLYH